MALSSWPPELVISCSSSVGELRSRLPPRAETSARGNNWEQLVEPAAKPRVIRVKSGRGRLAANRTALIPDPGPAP